MNELIEELAIKSGFKKYKNDDGLYSPYIEGYDLNDEIEEFAEHIIKECIKISDDSQYKCRTFPVSVAIKDHFGLD